ncbi:MAG TPA: hypothetical protein VIV60_31205 [Polyangiaceae bacterium]
MRSKVPSEPLAKVGTSSSRRRPPDASSTRLSRAIVTARSKTKQNASDEELVNRSASEDLERLQRGEIGFSEYLQARIDRATLHLRNRISSRKLERIRSIVTQACNADPVLTAMKSQLLRGRKG